MDTKNKTRVRLNTEAKDNHQTEYRFTINFYVYQEGNLYSAYCPSLDLITADTSFNGAITSFYEMFQLYVESCVEHNTLVEDMKRHGWKGMKKLSNIDVSEFREDFSTIKYSWGLLIREKTM